jgi:uncharacterized membrane protein
MAKQALVALGIIIAAGVAIVALSLSNGKPAYAQSTATQFVISSSSSTGASTVWIVDPITRRVIFCRQWLPNGSSEQLLQFNCKAQPLP